MRAPRLLEGPAALVRRRLRREHVEPVLPAIFGPLGPAELDWLEAQLTWRHLGRGEVLIRRGTASDGLYVVVSGTLVNDLPGDVVRRMGAGVVIAVDVGGGRPTTRTST
jgi:CRP-like cAMP-binding protein